MGQGWRRLYQSWKCSRWTYSGRCDSDLFYFSLILFKQDKWWSKQERNLEHILVYLFKNLLNLIKTKFIKVVIKNTFNPYSSPFLREVRQFKNNRESDKFLFIFSFWNKLIVNWRRPIKWKFSKWLNPRTPNSEKNYMWFFGIVFDGGLVMSGLLFVHGTKLELSLESHPSDID